MLFSLSTGGNRMLAVINFLVAIGLTIFYSIKQGLNLDFPGVFWILLVFIGSFVAMAIVLFLILVIFIYSTEKMSHKANWKHRVIKLYSVYIFNFYLRVRVIITGKENLPKDNNFVVYSNHIEYSDPIYLMQAYKNNPIGYVAKEPLFKYIVLKNMLLGLGCIPISRFADRSALKTILQAIKQVKEGQPMGVFPEGKRTYSNNLIEFKPGAFKVAQKAQADISPACLYNMHNMTVKRGILPVKVYIHILPVIKYEDYKDLDSVGISNMVFKIINDQMDKFKAA
jgi:1-acyl-sn-glycerol-3-phosphate acyltransferase